MSDRFDTLLREVIHDLAAEGDLVRPEDRDRRRFALDATDRAYQHRDRRRASLVGVVALVFALAVGVPYGLSFTRADGARGPEAGASPTSDVIVGPDGVPTHVITDMTRPIELVDGWYVLGNKYVLDWPNKTYAKVGGQSIQPSPNGQWVLARSSADYFAFRVTDLRTGRARTYTQDAVIGEPQWSPDGKRLLFSKPPVGEQPFRTLVAIVLDVETWESTTTLLDVRGLTCTEADCQLTWLPSGTEIAITLAHKGGGEYLPPVPFGIQTFTLDGARARSLPIAGAPTGPGSWSPDDRYVVVRGVSADGREHESHLVEVATGTVVRRIAGYFVQAAWVDNDHMLVWAVTPKDPDEWILEVTLQSRDGAVLERWQPPAEITFWPTGPTGPMAARLEE